MKNPLTVFREMFGNTVNQALPENDQLKPVLSCLKQAKVDQPKPDNQRPVGHRSFAVSEQAKAVVNDVNKSEVQAPREKTLDDWWNVLEDEPTGHSDWSKAFEEVLKSVDDLDGFVRLYDAIGSKSPSLPAMMGKIEMLQAGFDDWIETYENRSELDDFSNFLLKRAISLAKSPDDWISLWGKAENSHADDLKTVRDAFDKLQWTKEQWTDLHDRADGASDLETLATVQLVQFNETLVDLIEFYKEYKDNWNESNEADEAIFKAMFVKATRQELQLISALAGEYDELETAADEFLKKS